jgi:hypothetical protein
MCLSCHWRSHRFLLSLTCQFDNASCGSTCIHGDCRRNAALRLQPPHRHPTSRSSIHLTFLGWSCQAIRHFLEQSTRILMQVNKKIAAATGMPAEMQRFKELFLVSNKAIAADFISNQVVYHFGVALLLYAYTYSIRKYAVDKPPSLTGWGLLMKIGPDLLRTRLLMTVISIGSEYWMSYFSIQSIKGKLSIPEGSKRLILLKEFILSVAWYTFCLNKYYTNF